MSGKMVLLRNFLAGILIFTLVITGFYVAVSDLNANYGLNVSNEFDTTGSSLSDIQNISDQISSSLTDKNPLNPVDLLGGLATISSGLLKITMTTFTLPNDILSGLVTKFGFNSQLLNIGLLMLTLVVLFVIISAFMRNKV